METIQKVNKVLPHRSTIHEFITFNGKKFRITAELRNGRNTLKAEVLNDGGSFDFALGSNDVNFTYRATYVSNEAKKISDLNDAIRAMKDVIKIIYK